MASFRTEVDSHSLRRFDRESMGAERDGDVSEEVESERAARHRAEKRARELEDLVQRLSEAERVARANGERAERSRDYFISILSHDLRGPIGTILTWAHLLRGGQLSREKVTQALEAIERSARTQVRLLEQVVDLARLRSGRLSIDPQKTDLGAVAEAAVEAARSAADAKQVALTLTAEDRVQVHGDAERLRQSIGYLLDNAIRSTPESGKVDVVLRRNGSEAEVTLTDSGAGLEPDVAQSLVARARDPEPPGHGRRGLGLPLAVGLVELQGGSVELSSDGPGRGTVARVRLPQRGRGASPKGGSRD